MILTILNKNQLQHNCIENTKSFISCGCDAIGIDIQSILGSEIERIFTDTAIIISELNDYLIKVKIAVDEINLNQSLLDIYNPLKMVLIIPNLFVTETKSAKYLYKYILNNIFMVDIFIIDGINNVEEMMLINEIDIINPFQDLFMSLDISTDYLQENFSKFNLALNSDDAKSILFKIRKGFFKITNLIKIRNVLYKNNSIGDPNSYLESSQICFINKQIDNLKTFTFNDNIIGNFITKNNRIQYGKELLIRYWKNTSLDIQYFYSVNNKNIYCFYSKDEDLKRIRDFYRAISGHSIVCKIENIRKIFNGHIIEFRHSGKSLRWLIIKRFFSLNEECSLINEAYELYFKLNLLGYEHCNACLDNVLMDINNGNKLKIVFFDYIRKLDQHLIPYDIEKLVLDIFCIYIYKNGYVPKKILLYLEKNNVNYGKI